MRRDTGLLASDERFRCRQFPSRKNNWEVVRLDRNAFLFQNGRFDSRQRNECAVLLRN